jgi:hypothetical protein
MYPAESFRLRIEYRTLNILGEIYLVLSSLMRKVQLRQQDLGSTHHSVEPKRRWHENFWEFYVQNQL